MTLNSGAVGFIENKMDKSITSAKKSVFERRNLVLVCEGSCTKLLKCHAPCLSTWLHKTLGKSSILSLLTLYPHENSSQPR